jgi:nucleotide-binding universal stress UspA family protein
MLHTMEIPIMMASPEWPGYAAAMDIQGMKDDAKQHLQSFLRSEFGNIDTARVMLDGDPAWRIAQYVEKENVDLIMMPTHGYGPFRRLLLGSVTAKVLHDVKCPVWTGAHVLETSPMSGGYRNVICAVDVTEKSLSLLRWACLFACEQGALLKLAHAIPAATAPDGLDIDGASFRAALHDLAHQELAKLQKDAGTSFETIVQGGDVASVMRKAAEESRADLIVIGRGAMSKFLGRMRTNVYSIIRDAPCPVISV